MHTHISSYIHRIVSLARLIDSLAVYGISSGLVLIADAYWGKPEQALF